MTDDGCRHESRTLEALRTGRWSDDLREHRESCAECAELIWIEGLMERQQVDDLEAQAALPDARLIWLRHQREERARRLEMATLPIRTLETVISAVGAALAVVLLGGFLPTLAGWFGGIFAGFGNDLAALPATSPATLTAIMGRMSAYTGRDISWDWVLNESQLDLSPPAYQFGDLPVAPVAVPGQTELI